MLADRSGMIMSPAQLDKLGDKFGTNPVRVGPYKVRRGPLIAEAAGTFPAP